MIVSGGSYLSFLASFLSPFSNQELFNRNYVTTNAVENVLRRTSLTKKLDADMFRNRTRLYPRSPNQIDQVSLGPLFRQN